jgi:hypothetical protein
MSPTRNKILCNLRYPYEWEKVLAAKARKEKTTVSKTIGNILEKKFRYARINDRDTEEEN